MLEKAVEAAVVRHAKGLGLEVVKLNGMGRRSLPDRMFLGPRGSVLFIEFKREGAKPTPLQAHCHKRWVALGHRVYVVDSAVEGKALVERLTES